QQLCDLKSLEILDLGRNRIHVLPPQIVKLTSLKVLSIRKNPIQELPLCLADMASLQVLKLKDNNITFPPPEVLQAPIATPPNENILPGSDMVEMAVTAHIKEYLRRVALNGRVETDAGDESSEGAETPRLLPARRVASGRFPIRVNGSEVPDMRSPAVMRPPPIPTRSHYRGLSQTSTTMRRTSAMPLTIGSVSERTRSNSETGVSQPRAERPESRNRRMGVVSTKKSSDLATLDETQANNRFSHYRGLSHGSAMQGPGAVPSPASPPEPYMQRPIYVRRLSILPERRRESKIVDPVLEVAKGILYSVFQIHPMIQMLMSLTSDGSSKRSSLEIVFYNTNSHVEELEQAIQKLDPAGGGADEYAAFHEGENVHRACQTLVSAYTHVCTLLAGNIESFVDNGDPRYIRTLLVTLYNSIMELRVTMSGMAPGNRGFKQSAVRAAMGVGETIRPHSRESSVTPTAERPVMGSRLRNGSYTPGPSNLRVATDVPMGPYTNGGIRQAPVESATPRSGESFASVSSASLGRSMHDFADEDRQFEEVFLSLQRSAELVMRALPGFIAQLTAGLRNVTMQRDRLIAEEVLKAWKLTISRATTAVYQTETLKARLSLIKLKEPGIRTQAAFWAVCNNFFHAWGTFGETMKEAMTRYRIPIPPDARLRFRPIHQAMKETRDAILKSPWGYFLQSAGGGAVMSQFENHGTPVTPQSAALGPAVQATVPSTPQSASFSALSGNVFERADALLNYGGLSMMGSRDGSRSGTMSASGGSSLGSTLS
ncbi:MAG: hypothetical protein IMZ46_03600, partial [Acidobacteria bacterium]|nr:hypothetical protein [Acidobacteriota bacterium]